ncbi:MAG: oligoribonuclease [bacterium]|nr:oligoribonuclease [bacterium]
MKSKDVEHPQILIWMDLEMTGLNPEHDLIIEIASLATDWDLNLVAKGPDLAISTDPAMLAGMDAWCVEHHGASGLTQRCLDSSITLKEAEQQTLDWVKTLVPKGVTPLCGNSIHQDRRFLVKQMPLLDDYFHYRNLDVSTVKELAKRWYPQLPPFKKQGKHQALDDILESVEELRYYRRKVFIHQET